MKFFSPDIKKSILRSRGLQKAVFTRSFLVSVIVFSLIFDISSGPTIAHASFFSSFLANISDSISNFGPNQAQADGVNAISATATDTISASSDSESVLSAPMNSNPASTYDCVVPMTVDNTISSQLNPCAATTTTNTEISTYVVRQGDTLSEIAKLFGVSANTIVWVNDLNRNAPLQAGETLVILPVSGIQYTVKKGDTIKSIAAHYKVDQNQILQYNDITLSSVLNTGDMIIIPDAALEGSSETRVQTPEIKSTSSKSRWGAPGTEPAHNTNGPSYPGYYIVPLAHGIETQGLHGYNAVDLAAPTGTPILASAEGTVIISIKNGRWNGGYGNYVVINHPNGTQTLYAHMSKVLVTAGEDVNQGQTIGLVGATGEATGPHVHFEIHGAHNPFTNLTRW